MSGASAGRPANWPSVEPGKANGAAPARLKKAAVHNAGRSTCSRLICLEYTQNERATAVANGRARSARTATVLDRRRGAAAVDPARVRHAPLQRTDPAAAADPGRREHHALGNGGGGRRLAHVARFAGRAGGEPPIAGA